MAKRIWHFRYKIINAFSLEIVGYMQSKRIRYGLSNYGIHDIVIHTEFDIRDARSYEREEKKR